MPTVTGSVQEAPAAIGADLPVAREQHGVGEARDRGERASRAALDRQDRLGRDPRARAVALEAAAEFADDRAERPRHHLLRVVCDRFLQRDPRLGQAGHVDGQDERVHALIVIRLVPASSPDAEMRRAKARMMQG